MEIKIEKLVNPLILSLTGSEEWLKPAYEALKPECRDGLILGTIEVRSEGYGYAQVSGNIRYEPVVPCSRCSDWIPWTIDQNITVRFKPEENADMSGEIDLTSSDLDVYVAIDDKVDLCQVLIDTIMTSLPSKLIKPDPISGDCKVCGVSLKSNQVYGSKKDDSDNPFAVLKNLKLDD